MNQLLWPRKRTGDSLPEYAATTLDPQRPASLEKLLGRIRNKDTKKVLPKKKERKNYLCKKCAAPVGAFQERNNGADEAFQGVKGLEELLVEADRGYTNV